MSLSCKCESGESGKAHQLRLLSDCSMIAMFFLVPLPRALPEDGADGADPFSPDELAKRRRCSSISSASDKAMACSISSDFFGVFHLLKVKIC